MTAIPAAARAAIVERDGSRCWYCRRELHPHNLTIDHVIPRARGGPNSRRNMVPCCNPCNLRKDMLTGMEYLTVMGDDVRREALLTEVYERFLPKMVQVIRRPRHPRPPAVRIREHRESRLTHTIKLPPMED